MPWNSFGFSVGQISGFLFPARTRSDSGGLDMTDPSGASLREHARSAKRVESALVPYVKQQLAAQARADEEACRAYEVLVQERDAAQRRGSVRDEEAANRRFGDAMVRIFEEQERVRRKGAKYNRRFDQSKMFFSPPGPAPAPGTGASSSLVRIAEDKSGWQEDYKQDRQDEDEIASEAGCATATSPIITGAGTSRHQGNRPDQCPSRNNVASRRSCRASSSTTPGTWSIVSHTQRLFARNNTETPLSAVGAESSVESDLAAGNTKTTRKSPSSLVVQS